MGALGPRAAVIGYRWAVLFAALIAGYLGGAGQPTYGVLAAILVLLPISLIVTALIVTSHSSRVMVAIRCGDLVAGSVAIGLTGGEASPFLIYLTAPAIGIAIDSSAVELAVGIAVTAASYVLAIVGSSGLRDVGAAVDEVALLTLVPALVYQVRRPRERSVVRAVEVDSDDLVLLRRLAAGRTYAQIADELAFSPESVKVRVARLYRRLGARTRDDALHIARSIGILDGRE